MATAYLEATLPNGVGVAGLSPEFEVFAYRGGGDPGDEPEIEDLGGGFYVFDFEPEDDLVYRVNLDPAGVSGLAGGGRASGVLTPDDDAITEERLLLLEAATTRGRTRIKNPTFNDDGKLLSATLAYYRTSEDAENDQSPIRSVAVTATYDEGDLDSYVGLDP